MTIKFGLFCCFFLVCQPHGASGQISITAELMKYDSMPIKWDKPGKIQSELNEGLNNMREHQFEIAIVNFLNVLALDSMVLEARYYKAMALKNNAQLPEAEFELRKLLLLYPSSYLANIERGKVLHLLRRLLNATNMFQLAKKIKPSLPMSSYQQGLLKMTIQDTSAAASFFNESLRCDPNFSPAKVRLALISLYDNHGPAASRLVNEVLANEPKNVDALYLRAFINVKNKPEKALVDLESILTIVRNHIEARVLKGVIKTNQGDYNSAFVQFQKLLKETSIDQAIFRGHRSIFDQAFDLQSLGYHMLSNMYGLPDADLEWVKKAYCLLVVGQYDQSIRTIKKVAGCDDYSFCLFLQGIASEHKGDHKKALKLYEKCSQIDAGIWEVHKKIAIYYTSINKWSEAEIEFSKGIELSSQATSLIKLRGVARFHKTDYSGAQNDFEAFLQTDSTDFETMKNLQQVYLKQKKFKLAIKNYVRADGWGVSESAKVSELSDLMLLDGDTLLVINLLDKFFNKTFAKFASDKKFTILLAQKDTALLKEHLSKFELFVKQNPHVFTIENTFLIKAAAYTNLGDFDSAKQYFNKSEKSNLYNAWFYLYRAKMLFRIGEKSRATQDARLAFELGSDEVRSYLRFLNVK